VYILSAGRPGVKLPALGGFDPANLRANLRKTPHQQPPHETLKDVKKEKVLYITVVLVLLRNRIIKC